LREDARNPWTAESRIARLKFDDGPDEGLVRPFRPALLRAPPRREQPAVLATHQRLMQRQERRRAQGHGELSNPASIEEERPGSAYQPVAPPQVARPPP